MWSQHPIRAVLAALALLSPGPADAQTGSEILQLPIPERFHLVNQTPFPAGEVQEYAPLGQTTQTWREMITVQRFPGQAGRPADEFLSLMADLAMQACPVGQANEVGWVADRPTPTAELAFFCPLSPVTGGPEYFVAIAMSGRENMHVVQYAWRHRPSPDELSTAADFFSTALLCDPSRADMPCPGVVAPQPLQPTPPAQPSK